MLYPLSYEGSRRNDRVTIPADGYDRVLMADPLHTVARTLRDALAAATGLPASDIDPVVRPSDRADAQANGALALAKQLGRNPR